MSEVSEMLNNAAQLHRQNKTAEAMAAYSDLLMRWPKAADAWYNLAILQRQTLRLGEALNSYQRALSNGIARPEEVHLNRSVIFSDFLRDQASAAAELQQALTLNPAYIPALINLANLYEDAGKRSEASSLYARILAIEPNAFEALARFANVQAAAGVDAALIERLRQALELATAMSERASLGFALGRLLDAKREYHDAFAAYTLANQASWASTGGQVIAYERARHSAFVDRLISSGTPSVRAVSSSVAPRPIFIVGMFRSGSTLTEQLLAGIPGVAAGGEINFLPQTINTELNPFFASLAGMTAERMDGIAARYRTEFMRAAAGADFVTDKRLDNFLYIGLIKRLFPDAKIVHTTRDPLDNCLSIFFLHLDQQMSYALNLSDTAHYYREYRRLMAHWKREFAGDIFDFSYDALVKEPQRQFKALCEFLNLPWPGEVPKVVNRGAVKTASVWQVREPLYSTSSGRSRHYLDDLKELRQELADLS
ncbi:MAG TPA: sulfotransferase [Steroidobacteraceae bacterium]|nr:sulfotransferase [Steroidobacteraceae bacterium]